MSTRLVLRDALRSEVKIDDPGRIWADSVLNRNLETAKRKIQQDGDFQWHFNDAENSESTVASQREYDLPSNFVRIESGTVRYDAIQLTPISFAELRRRHTALTTDGTPSVYYLRGTKIGLYLRPSGIETLDYLYRKSVPDYSADSTDSGLPSDFDEAMIQYACYLTWNDIQGRSDKAVEAIQNYKEIMEGLFAKYLGRRDESDFFFKFETVEPHDGIYFR